MAYPDDSLPCPLIKEIDLSGTENTDVIIWNVTSHDHGQRSTTYALTGDGYGYLLGRTSANELVLFNTWEDLFFDQISNTVEELLKDYRGTLNCFGLVLGIACDPAPSGNRYDFSGKIWCPLCGSENVDYGPKDPSEFTSIDLPVATHVE
jgi:hypothetical protein